MASQPAYCCQRSGGNRRTAGSQSPQARTQSEPNHQDKTSNPSNPRPRRRCRRISIPYRSHRAAGKRRSGWRRSPMGQKQKRDHVKTPWQRRYRPVVSRDSLAAAHALVPDSFVFVRRCIRPRCYHHRSVDLWRFGRRVKRCHAVVDQQRKYDRDAESDCYLACQHIVSPFENKLALLLYIGH